MDLSLHPVDLIIAILGVSIGILSRFRGILLLLQVSTLVVKMAKWYYDTHPEAKKRLSKDIDDAFDEIYDRHLKKFDLGLKHQGQTKKAG